MAQLSVSPKVSLADEAVRVQLLREPSDRNVSSIKLKLSLTNHSDMHFQSVTQYDVNTSASSDVILDLDRDLPTLGESDLCGGLTEEEGPWPMYSFWSLRAQPGSIPRLVSNDASKHFDCQILAFDADDSKLLGEASFTRLLMAPGVRRIPIAEGKDSCNGTLFLPPPEEYGVGPYPLIVRLYGGIQRGNVMEDQSAVLAARTGAACFSMGYFGVNNLPKSYVGRLLDLDFFEKSLNYLFSLPEVRADLGAIVIGNSKGAEIAMLMSVFLQEKISAVISINGLCNVCLNDVTYQGRTVLQGFFLDKLRQLLSVTKVRHVKGKLVNVLRVNDLCKFEGHHSTIPLHLNKDAKYLFIASEDDQFYDMKRYQKHMKANISNWEMEERCSFLDCQNTGHMVGYGPYDPPQLVTNHPLFPKGFTVQVGGSANPLGHVVNQGKVWTEILNFIRTVQLESRPT